MSTATYQASHNGGLIMNNSRSQQSSTGGEYNNNNNNNNNNDRQTIHNVMKPMKEPLDPTVMQKASRYAVRVLEEMSKRSKLLRFIDQEDDNAYNVAKFDRDEIIPYLGELLGKGGFNNVYELERVQLKTSSEFNSTGTSTNAHTNLSSSSVSSSSKSKATHNHNNRNETLRNNIVTNRPKLAVKFLSDEALQNPEDACNGSADLLMESKYLTALASHPHPALIQLYGISREGAAGFSSTERAGFFLIIDRLYDTLDRRIDVWREIQKRKNIGRAIAGITPPTHNDIENTPKYLHVLLIQRLVTALEIVSALAHLHNLSIVFRDLKPDNVGFDYNGRVKIFDFGLAKELDPKQQVPDMNGLYNMSGGTGSRRFMAPEVSLSEPYGLSADMYSFSILLWELLTMEKAFGRLSVDEHRARVVLGQERPPLHSKDAGWVWSNNRDLVYILEGCWRRDPLTRPESKVTYEELKVIIQSMIQEQFPLQYTVGSTSIQRAQSAATLPKHYVEDDE